MMISGSTILVVVLTVVIYYIFFGSKKKWDKAPPGPSGLPIFGNMLQMDKLQHVSFVKWAKEFGSIYKITMLNVKMVVISDYKLLKEIFSEAVFTGRMDFHKFDWIPDGKCHGIINTEGEHWEELRRFTLRQLRDFGFGKSTMEESIMLEVIEMISGIKEVEGKSISNIKDRLVVAVVNSLWQIIAGKRHKHSDPKILSFINNANETFNETLANGSSILFVPWIADWFPKWSGYEKLAQSIQNFAEHFRQPMLEHKKTYSDDYQRDFIDVFLKEIKNTDNTNSAFYGKLGEDHLLATLGDLYFAGSDTTSTTLTWLTMYLSKYPEIQTKFQNEIESITGNNRACSVADRPNMPYTEALFAETLRFSSIASAGVSHRATADAEFKGYKIPKDTVLVPNLYYIHFDPSVWGDPEKFRPERFLSSDGKIFKKHDALIAFSIGRRQCLGESLARDSLFLFATNLFQRFTVEFDKNGPDHGFESEVSFVLTPKPFNLIFKDRIV